MADRVRPELESPRYLRLSSVGIGVLVSLMVALLLSSFITIAVYFSPLSEDMVPLLVNVSGVAAVFAGGLCAGKSSSRMGWIHGGLAGLVFTLVLLVGIPSPGAGLILLIKQLALAFVVGGLGGAFGVNLS